MIIRQYFFFHCYNFQQATRINKIMDIPMKQTGVKRKAHILLMNPFLATKVRERFYAGSDLFGGNESTESIDGSLAVGGFLRLQQTLTSCVAPLEEFTSLRQPVKSGNSTLITISRTKLFMRPHGGEFSHKDPRGSTRIPFSRILVSFYLHRLRERPLFPNKTRCSTNDHEKSH